MKTSPRNLSLLPLLLLTATAAFAMDGPPAPELNPNVLGTRSIVACDIEAQACGIGVMSFPPTSATVPYGRPGLALANQMFPSVDVAQAVMSLTEKGTTPQQALDTVLAMDPGAAMRQIGFVKLLPNGAVQVGQYTGGDSWTQRCAVAGATYAVQAAGQTSTAVCQAMAQGFEQATGSLAVRLMAALKTGAQAGQDARGERSGTVRVWSSISPLSELTQTIADASVSGRRDALAHLESELYRYLGQMAPEESANRVELDATTARHLKHALRALGYYRGPMHGRWTDEAEKALAAFQASNVVFPRQTLEQGGKRYIDGAFVQFLLRAEYGSLVPAPR